MALYPGCGWMAGCLGGWLAKVGAGMDGWLAGWMFIAHSYHPCKETQPQLLSPRLNSNDLKDQLCRSKHPTVIAAFQTEM